MSNNVARWSFVLTVVLFASSEAGAVTIDFDFFPDLSPVPDGTVITDQYEDFGVLVFVHRGRPHRGRFPNGGELAAEFSRG